MAPWPERQPPTPCHPSPPSPLPTDYWQTNAFNVDDFNVATICPAIATTIVRDRVYSLGFKLPGYLAGWEVSSKHRILKYSYK